MIYIESVVKESPCTLRIVCEYYHNRFIVHLAGACLEFLTSNPLSSDKEDKFKEKLIGLFPLRGRCFNEKDIDEVINENLELRYIDI